MKRRCNFRKELVSFFWLFVLLGAANVFGIYADDECQPLLEHADDDTPPETPIRPERPVSLSGFLHKLLQRGREHRPKSPASRTARMGRQSDDAKQRRAGVLYTNLLDYVFEAPEVEPKTTFWGGVKQLPAGSVAMTGFTMLPR
uniref:Apical protein 1 n=1 Tax=Sarcocystis neurona TaxID=42890 RepID=B6EBF2_SARNE|nr:apical protein 1 [Sarcocystis neurona]